MVTYPALEKNHLWTLTDNPEGYDRTITVIENNAVQYLVPKAYETDVFNSIVEQSCSYKITKKAEADNYDEIERQPGGFRYMCHYSLENADSTSKEKVMIEFYRLVFNSDTNSEKVEKIQYELTPDTSQLKEKLESEIDKYELVETVFIDRYYHADKYERTYPLSLSQSVFLEDKFVGYMINGMFYLISDANILISKEIRGALSTKVYENIRKKR